MPFLSCPIAHLGPPEIPFSRFQSSLLTLSGAALDVYVVVENWNASDIDVIVGSSAQLHALTNIPVRVKRWRAVIWCSHLISLVLIVQASMQARLLGSPTEQIWGSIIWLLCYQFMLVPSFFVSRNNPDMILKTQPAQVMRLPPVNFLGRRAALAFIATIPEDWAQIWRGPLGLDGWGPCRTMSGGKSG